VNRRERRANGQRGCRTLTQSQIRRAIACPDCAADVDSVEIEPGAYQVFVYHDLTCPWLSSFEHGGGFGVHFGREPPP
jgi:hypothetical protein